MERLLHGVCRVIWLEGNAMSWKVGGAGVQLGVLVYNRACDWIPLFPPLDQFMIDWGNIAAGVIETCV